MQRMTVCLLLELSGTLIHVISTWQEANAVVLIFMEWFYVLSYCSVFLFLGPE